MKRKAVPSAFLTACFFFSGLSGLVYEVVWTRQLSMAFGSTALAAGICMAAYLGGMAAGSEIFGRLAARYQSPQTAYAAMEFLIGLYGLVSPWLLAKLGVWYAALLLRWEWAPLAGGLVQFLMTVILLAFPTLLMGGTLPVLVAADRSERPLATRAGLLYASNIAGAAAGAFLAGFWLLPSFGLIRTVWFAAIVNLALGASVWFAYRHRSSAGESGSSSTSAASAAHQGYTLRHRLLLVLVLVSGFTSLYYEVLWVRTLELILGNSSQAFSLMLTIFLAGLGIGVWVAAQAVRRTANPLVVLTLSQAGAAAVVWGSLHLIPRLPDLYLHFHTRMAFHPVLFLGAQALLAASIILPPAVLLGMTFPLALAAGRVRERQESRLVGRLYAMSTLGCILGSLLAAPLFIPWIGLRRGLLLGCLLNAAAALLAANILRGAWPAWRWGLTGLVAALAFYFPLKAPSWDINWLTSGVFSRAPEALQAGLEVFRASTLQQSTILFHKEGPSASVTVKQSGGGRTLLVDGRGEGGTRASAQALLGHLPFLTGRPVREVFVLGLGTGNTAGTAALHGAHRVTVAELEPAVAEASWYFADLNHRALAHPAVRLRLADGRSLLAACAPESFDAIISQPSVPSVPGAAKLFTREFYRLARTRLAHQGVFVQWVQLYDLDRAALLGLLRAFLDAFPQTLLLEVSQTAQEIMLIGGLHTPKFDYEAVQLLYRHPALRRELHRIRYRTPGSLLAQILLGPDELARISSGYLANTDDNGLVEFTVARSRFRATAERNINFFRQQAVHPFAFIQRLPEGKERFELLLQMAEGALGEIDMRRSRRFLREAAAQGASPEYYRIYGDVMLRDGRRQEAVMAWRKALDLAPDSQTILERLVNVCLALPPQQRPREFPAWFSKMRAVRVTTDEVPQRPTSGDVVGP